jgi:hypothetical protein
MSDEGVAQYYGAGATDKLAVLYMPPEVEVSAHQLDRLEARISFGVKQYKLMAARPVDEGTIIVSYIIEQDSDLHLVAADGSRIRVVGAIPMLIEIIRTSAWFGEGVLDMPRRRPALQQFAHDGPNGAPQRGHDMLALGLDITPSPLFDPISNVGLLSWLLVQTLPLLFGFGL